MSLAGWRARAARFLLLLAGAALFVRAAACLWLTGAGVRTPSDVGGARGATGGVSKEQEAVR